MTLRDMDEVYPGQVITVKVSAWGYDPGTLEQNIRNVFDGSIFRVNNVTIPTLILPVGVGQDMSIQGDIVDSLGSGGTLPDGANMTVSEFRDFVSANLGRISGLYGENVQRIEAGDTSGDNTTPFGIPKWAIYAGVGIVGLFVIGYVIRAVK